VGRADDKIDDTEELQTYGNFCSFLEMQKVPELVLGTNPNPTESGCASCGLRIQSVKVSEFSSPDPDPVAKIVAKIVAQKDEI
jgi:hypothetical protein